MVISVYTLIQNWTAGSRAAGRGKLDAPACRLENSSASRIILLKYSFFRRGLAIYSRIRLPSNYETVVIAHYLCMHKVPTG